MIPKPSAAFTFEGDELLLIDNGEYRYRLQQALAEHAELEAKLQRLGKMRDQELVSAEEFETMKSDLSAAEAAEGLAQLNLSYTRVVAPFSGRIVTRRVNVGQTVNVGTQLFSRSQLGFEEGRGGKMSVSTGDLMREVRRHFPPEFLNRIDEIICFSPLSPEDVQSVARHKVDRLVPHLLTQGRHLELTPAAEELIAQEGYSADEGARNLERTSAVRRSPTRRSCVGPTCWRA